MNSEMTERLTRLAETQGYPVDMQRLAIEAGISRVVTTEMQGDAVLVRTANNLSVFLNQSQIRQRQRFSCAHEIAHAVIGIASHAHRQPVVERDSLEMTCDKMAANLLMPKRTFTQRLNELGASLDSLIRLSEDFDTSLPATAIRMVELSQEPIIVVFWSFRSRPGSTEKLRVDWYTSSYKMFRQRRFFIPKHVPAQPHSTFYKAFADGRAVKCWELFEQGILGNLKGVFYTEAYGYQFGDRKHVISLVFPERVKSNGGADTNGT